MSVAKSNLVSSQHSGYWVLGCAGRSIMLATSFLTNSHHEVSATAAAPFIEVSAYLRCTLPSKEVKQKREHDIGSEEQFNFETTCWDVQEVPSVMLATSFLKLAP